MASEASKVTEAAMAVMRALEGLSPEECTRVLESAAALFSAPISVAPAARAAGTGIDDQDGGSVDHPGKRRSLTEFLNEKSPATNAQRIAAFAYYREHVEKKPHFARTDLAAYFAPAKLPRPGNYDRDYSSAVKEGWIHDEGESSYLTTTGEGAVVAGFAGKAKPRGRAAAKRASRKSKKATNG